MRAEKEHPSKVYENFWDWLYRDWHPVFLGGLGVGFLYYLITTEEV